MSATVTALVDALLARLIIHDPVACDCLLPDDLDAIIAAARAESDARIAALVEAAIAETRRLYVGTPPNVDDWDAHAASVLDDVTDRIRALAAPPVAPAPPASAADGGTVEPLLCADCGQSRAALIHATRFGPPERHHFVTPTPGVVAPDVAEGPCIFVGCVSRERHWHGGFPGGYDNPADPEGPPIPFTREPDPGVRDYHGAILVRHASEYRLSGVPGACGAWMGVMSRETRCLCNRPETVGSGLCVHCGHLVTA